MPAQNKGEPLPWANTTAKARWTAIRHLEMFGLHRCTVDITDLTNEEIAAAESVYQGKKHA